MFRTILRKEIVSHVLSLRFGMTFILFVLLVFASVYVTTNEYERDKARYASGERGAADHIARLVKEKDDWRQGRRILNWEGRLDPVPVPRLSSVAQGLWPSMPVGVNTTTDHSRNMGRGAERNPLSGLLHIPDMVYVVSVVLSLLAILFAFDCICGEKESGTLRLMLSNAVPRDSVLLGKWLGGYGVLVIPFLIAAAGGLGYAWWKGALQMDAGQLSRIGVMLLIALLYISVFFTLSLFVSTTTHRSTTALFICLLIWVVWILAIPNLAPVVAKILVPAPSVEKINAEKAAVDKEIGLRMDRLTLTTGELGYGKRIKDEREKLRREGERVKRRWDRFLDEATRRQTELAETLGRLSPAVCWTYSAVSLMETGPGSYRRFRDAQKKLIRDMRDLGGEHGQVREKTGKWKRLTVDEIPRLHLSSAGLGAAVKDSLVDIVILAVLNVVFFMAAFVCFLRYDVR